MIKNYIEAKENKSKPKNYSQLDRVERAGYLNIKQQVSMFMQAGKQLRETRKELFHFPEGNYDEEFYDPTAAKGFSFSDVQEYLDNAEGAKKRVRDAINEKKEAENSANKARREQLKSSDVQTGSDGKESTTGEETKV